MKLSLDYIPEGRRCSVCRKPAKKQELRSALIINYPHQRPTYICLTCLDDKVGLIVDPMVSGSM